MDHCNFADLHSISAALGKSEIVANVEKFILENFKEIRYSENLLNLPFTYLRHILSSSHLKVKTENEVLEAVLELCKKMNAADEWGMIDRLLSCIRLEQLESGEVMEAAFENRILTEREEWTKRIGEALQRKRDADSGFVEGIGRDESER